MILVKSGKSIVIVYEIFLHQQHLLVRELVLFLSMYGMRHNIQYGIARHCYAHDCFLTYDT